MNGTRTHRPLPVLMRPLVVVLLGVCLQGSGVPGFQDSAVPREFPRSAWAAIAHGKLSEAESVARAQPADDADAAAILGHLAIRQGRYDEAVKLLEPAAAQSPVSQAALELGLLHLRLGRSEAAGALLTPLFRQGSGASDPQVVARAARAAQAIGRPHDANSLFRSASNAAGGDPSIDTPFALLFLDRFDEPEAVRRLQLVVKEDPQWAPAYAGIGWGLADENPPAAAGAAMKALEIDPNLDSALLLLAQLDLDNSRTDAARERLAKILAVNPQHLDARSLVAAIAYVKGDRAAYEKEVRGVLAIHPGFGEVYRAAADLAARNYRFEEAVALARQATTLDPSSAKAFGDLGMHLLRTGDEPEARRALERSFDADRFNRVTYNLLMLLDKLDQFTVVEAGDLVVKMHPDEAPVLREYAVPLAKDALKTLSEKYGFTPKGPILVEIFPVHDDFAVRNLGLPGMIGALGACFGRVVTMDSPKAKPSGEFSWQATLWHEIAHVITLQMSNQRVPRWLTEGISVYEEAQARPEWGRDMEVPFAAALEQGKALKLTDLNAGFTSPETIALAYFQASLLVDHIVKTYGAEKLRALVRSYGEGSEGDGALTKTLGSSMEQLQASFDKAVDARFGQLRTALRPVKGVDPADPGALRAAMSAHPQNYGIHLAYGRALASAKDKAAFEPLERAASLVPMATGDDSPHALMAELAVQLGDEARAVREYQALLAHDHTTVDSARKLAALAEKLGDADAAALGYERVVALDPSDAAAHTGLGRLALKKSQPDIAVREFKAALALGPADRASAHCDLGEGYLAKGLAADAKREALAALEIAPTFERAQELLLKAIQSKASARPRP
ncbi:MAG TPA: tetratricopeptide repeat protein [Vicinamibacterales bacterium]|nr:tetratricopeptide repeat protein [Vicinamibacterales bacterium]